jgi:hypothetical protein
VERFKKFISFNEIMSRLVDCNNLDDLSFICDYLNKNKKKYPLIQLEFAVECYEDKKKELTTMTNIIF